jgi:hypothetical protein
MKQVLTTFGALLGFAMVTPAIQATLLTPGAGPTALTGISSLPAGSIVSNGGNASVLPFVGTDASGTTLYQGTLYLAVYREAATGFLDFLYQIQNSKKSQNGIQRTTNADFSAASSVDATFLVGTAPRGFLSARGEIAPATADLSSNGAVVGFSFPTDTPIGPAKTSAVFMIRTNVKGFRAGSTTIVGGVSTVAPDLAGGPEPSGLVLFAGSFLGLAVWMGWRRWKGTLPRLGIVARQP